MSYKSFVCILVMSFMAGAPLYAAAAERNVLVQNAAGSVEYQKGGEGDWAPAAKDAALSESDIVRTGDASTCDLLFKGMSDTTVQLRPNSVLELSTVSEEKTGDDTELDLTIGSVLVKAEKLKGDSAFQVRTPNSIVGIRGTEFEVNVD